jgi:hypothetical protein
MSFRKADRGNRLGVVWLADAGSVVVTATEDF